MTAVVTGGGATFTVRTREITSLPSASVSTAR
jgi:hypothetical protein